MKRVLLFVGAASLVASLAAEGLPAQSGSLAGCPNFSQYTAVNAAANIKVYRQACQNVAGVFNTVTWRLHVTTLSGAPLANARIGLRWVRQGSSALDVLTDAAGNAVRAKRTDANGWVTFTWTKRLHSVFQGTNLGKFVYRVRKSGQSTVNLVNDVPGFALF